MKMVRRNNRKKNGQAGVRQGIIFLENGCIYKGGIKKGVPHGFGRLVDAQGALLEFRNGWNNGSGNVVNAEGCSIYEGHFKDGFFHGHGKQVHPNGVVYEGEFAKDLQHGLGKFTFPGGTVFETESVNGDQLASGKLTDSDGSVYEGLIRISNKGLVQCHGHGNRTCANDGTYYEGEWYKNRPHGKGIQIWPDGSRFEGHVHRGLAHGPGKWYRADGSVKFDGVFQHGSRIRNLPNNSNME